MRLRSIFATGLYLSLVPLVGATGTWTEPMAAAPFADVEAPALSMAPGAQVAAATSAAPPIRAARLERRDACAGLSTAVAAIGRAETGTVWLGWTTPARAVAARTPRQSWYGDVNRCVLDDDGDIRDRGGMDDGAERLVIFARLVSRSIDRVAFTDARCTVDAGAKTVYWLERVAPGAERRAAGPARSTGRGRQDRPQR